MRKDRRNVLLAGLVAVAVVGGLGWLVFRNHEPVYQGKRLSEWLSGGMHMNGLDMDRTLLDTSSAHLDASAERAVREIETNGIPTLLGMLRAHNTKLTLKLIGLVRQQHATKINFVPASYRNLEAAVAFGRLGAAASNAVPGLVQVYEEQISKTSQMAAADSIGNIGPAATSAVPALLRTVADTNNNDEVREDADLVLREVKTSFTRSRESRSMPPRC